MSPVGPARSRAQLPLAKRQGGRRYLVRGGKGAVPARMSGMDGLAQRRLWEGSPLPTHCPWGRATLLPPPHHLPLTSPAVMDREPVRETWGHEVKSAKLSHSASQEGSLEIRSLAVQTPAKKSSLWVQPIEGGF